MIEHLEQSAELLTQIQHVRSRSEWLHQLPSDTILALLDDFATKLGQNQQTALLEGGSFLVFWLRRTNLERLLNINFGHGGRACLDTFVDVHGTYLKAQPAGLVGHWVAGNVPTLAVFSWVLSLLTKNVAVVRVSEATLEPARLLLDVFRNAEANGICGEDVLQSAAFVHFHRDNMECHRLLSQEADCKVIWGSSQAVQTVSGLPRQEHCTELVFGPKYSLGVIDRETQETRLTEVARAFVRDILIFDQRACSSPQTIFVEPSSLDPEQLVETFAEQFDRLSKASPKREIDTFTATRIYTTRAMWGLDTDRTFRASAGADWTVCFDTELALKEAVQSRTVFLTGVDAIMDVVPLLHAKIQTVGLAVSDREKAMQFADAVTRCGVSRCVKPGLMNVYDLPWDGKLALSELVRWVTLQT